VGSTIEELNKAYGAGQSENDSEQWVSYELGIKLPHLRLGNMVVKKVAMLLVEQSGQWRK
jgi:hypothetical protein